MPLGPVRVFYSALDPTYVGELVAADYDVGTPDGCRLLFAGHNDTYEVSLGDARYAFRLHTRDKWWLAGESDVRFELELLAHLHEQGAPVSYPLPRRGGELVGSLTAPEGERFYSLFSWAPGVQVDVEAMSDAQASLVGRAMATVHVAADLHAPTQSRYLLDERTLLDRSLEDHAAELAEASPEDGATITRHVDEIRSRLASFDPGSTGWGIVHGDIQALNYHFDDRGGITVFDFDLCGFGWRAYDLSYYHSRVPEPVRDAVLAGYESVRPLTADEREMLPTFARLAWIRADGWPLRRLANLLRDPYQDWRDA